MKKQYLTTGELLSALMDGQLSGDDHTRALSDLLLDPAAQLQWHSHHVVGDTLRSADLAPGRDDFEFLERLQQRLASESALRTVDAPSALAVSPMPSPRTGKPCANTGGTSRWRWSQSVALGMFALLVAVLSAGGFDPGNTPTLMGANDAPTATEASKTTTLATAEALQKTELGTAGAQVPSAQDTEVQVVLRDPELDAMLAAHRAAGGNSALQLPSGFLRNATFERPNR